MRIDEFSRNKLRKSHAVIQVLTAKMQELQEIMNYMNDSRQLHDGKLSREAKRF